MSSRSALALTALGRSEAPGLRGRALSLVDTLGAIALSPVELIGMAVILLARMGEFIALAPFARHRFAFHALIFGRDLADLLIGPALRVVALSAVLGVTVAVVLDNYATGLLSQTGTANLVIVATVQQIPPFVASGVLAARGALPLSIRLAEMVDRGQIDSMAIMGVDLVMLHAVPRCLAVSLASVVHALLAMVVFGLTTGLTLSLLGIVPMETFFAALRMLPLFAKVGLIGLQLLTASLLVVAVAVVQGIQGSGEERVDLAQVSMVCILKAATVVLVVNVSFALSRMPELPVLVWR
jgi:ABC-type transporter Mla maintaining outer membrane lipid asymmetry permease subunit MlaE